MTKTDVESIFNNVVLIGEYDCFYGADVVINGKALSNNEIKETTNEICGVTYKDYPEYFNKKFPNKLVIYCCDGIYSAFYNGEEIKI